MSDPDFVSLLGRKALKCRNIVNETEVEIIGCPYLLVVSIKYFHVDDIVTFEESGYFFLKFSLGISL